MLTTNQNLQQGRYRIVTQLGQNGSGTNYEAFDNTLGASVLLKEIRDNLGKVATPVQLEARKVSFAKKAKALTEMRHESLLLVKDFFSEIDHHYLVTEFAGEKTLGELLEKNKKPFPLSDVSNWADSLLDALNYLHTLTPTVIHGEVKPQNITLSANGKAKLLVFNLVKNADEKNAAGNLTFDAAVLPYLPLEQIWDGLDAASKKVILTNYDDKSERVLEQPADARSDVFSLGATLYHLLTARIPADALTRSIDILEGKADPLQSPTQLNPSIPQEVSEVLMKALEIKRENRFSSAVIMRQVLRTAFVRVKEREANKVKSARMEDDAVLEIPVTTPQPVFAAAPPAAPKNLEMESEQARQLELIKQQLREAEARRLEAEQRAAQAEKRLLEAEKSTAAEPVKAAEKAVSAKSAEESAPTATALGVSNEPENAATPFDSNADDFSGLFAEPPREGGAFKKVAAAAVALVVLGGAGFGIYTVTQSKSAETLPTISTTNAAIPAPTVESKPVPTTENAPETTEQATTENPLPADPASAETADPASNPNVVRPKPAAATPTPQTAQVKKPAATPPAKQTDTQKKVTLDDLLKDN
jgi:serine/threonine protein kinase